MNRFQRVIAILDRAVGGPSVTLGYHGTFWRNLSRNDFVARKVFGRKLITVGDGPGSNLVMALKGQSPFGADLPDAPPDATFSRMPAGLQPVPPADIAFIETWINEGCLEDDGVKPAAAQPNAARRAALPLAPSLARRATVASLMADTAPPKRDLPWLKAALQIATQLELATLPPYLTAYWTIKDAGHEARKSIKEVWREEMTHFGLACNLLVAIDGMPVVTEPSVIPVYPGHLPGGVRPGLIVPLRKLDKAQAKVFMDIEYPQGGPITSAFAGAETYDSIGEFYAAILATFQKENPSLKLDRQIQGRGLYKIDTIAKVEQAIQLINHQGEGSKATPEEKPGDLAHYYRFGQIYNECRYVLNAATAKWGYDPAAPLPLPATWDMADIPEGGYRQADVPDMAIWDTIQTFDQRYSNMLRLLEDTWRHGDSQFLTDAIGEMGEMADLASQLVDKPRADGNGNYGPCFRYIPAPS